MRNRIEVSVTFMHGCQVYENFRRTSRNGIWGIKSDDLSRIEWPTVAEQVSTGTSSRTSTASAVESARCESAQGLE
jgi:hypothetical protein